MGCDPNIFTDNVLSHIHAGAGKLDAASEIFEKLGEVNCRPNCIMYSLLIDTHTKAGRAKQALSFYKWTKGEWAKGECTSLKVFWPELWRSVAETLNSRFFHQWCWIALRNWLSTLMWCRQSLLEVIKKGGSWKSRKLNLMACLQMTACQSQASLQKC